VIKPDACYVCKKHDGHNVGRSFSSHSGRYFTTNPHIDFKIKWFVSFSYLTFFVVVLPQYLKVGPAKIVIKTVGRKLKNFEKRCCKWRLWMIIFYRYFRLPLPQHISVSCSLVGNTKTSTQPTAGKQLLQWCGAKEKVGNVLKANCITAVQPKPLEFVVDELLTKNDIFRLHHCLFSAYVLH